MKRVLVNGIEADYVSVYDRGLQYGDGVFETVLCHAGQLYYWPQHYRRLLQSAQKFRLACPSQEQLLAEISRLLATDRPDGENSACHAIKIILTRADSERGYAFSKRPRGRRIVLVSAIAPAYSSLVTQTLEAGRLFVCQTQASINASLAGHKHLNRLANVMARNEFDDDCMDGLMSTAGSHVISGSMSNLFAIKGKAIHTPDLRQSGVKGIMRERIMTIIKQLDYPLHISTMTLTELENMDALFISNSLIGMRPVSAMAETTYPVAGPAVEITQQIFEALLADSREQLASV